MAEFLEERLSVEIDYGGSFSQEHAVRIIPTAGGNEYRSLRHPYVLLSYDIGYERKTQFVIDEVLDLYERANGMFRGFRVKDLKDFSTNAYNLAPTMLDQPLVLVSAGVYQLMRWYGSSSDTKAARRRIRKPVAGTVLFAVAGVAYPAAQWSVSTITGLVTLAANKSRSITGITQAAQAVITVGSHTFLIGESVAISGVVGMTQINGQRALITAISGTTITVAINSTAYSAYSSGGTVQTHPITGEAVTAGCQFDVPCRFATQLNAAFSNWDTINASGLQIIEILNP